MLKTIYANNVMHNNGQMKPENIYITPIHMYARIRLVYIAYIYV